MRRTIDASQCVQRVDQLRGLGHTVQQIADLTNLPTPTVWHLACTRPSRVYLHTHNAIMAAGLPEPVSDLPRRQLQALAAAGWSQGVLADHYPISAHTIQKVRAGGRAPYPATAQVIARMWHDLHHLRPQGVSATQVRLAATRNGWGVLVA